MIMARITIDGKLCQFSTKQSIQPANWNITAGKTKDKLPKWKDTSCLLLHKRRQIAVTAHMEVTIS